MMQPSQPSIAIVAPCYNEGATVITFLHRLEEVLRSLPFVFRIIVVDDGSTDDTADLLGRFLFAANNISLTVATLQHNLGHQAAIYHGLAAAKFFHPDHCIIMDADGEDDPAVITLLLAHRQYERVHVVRGGRKASLPFRVGYGCYRLLFRAATGRQMNYGNYCIVSSRLMDVAVTDGFRHFAAFLSRQQGSRHYITAARPPRIGGTSRMSIWKLVRHGLHAIAEYRSGLPAGRTLTR